MTTEEMVLKAAIDHGWSRKKIPYVRPPYAG
jgi:hypothetical protein